VPEVVDGAAALARIAPGEIARLTEAATNATFYRDDLTSDQRAANRRIVEISEATARAAAARENQNFSAAFVDSRFAGYVIATRHAATDLELDWLMVHPDFHGTDVAASLMRRGIAWLGEGNAMWLNVIRHNERAIRFYRRFGFGIDPAAKTAHIVPHVIMRRSPWPLGEMS
jgi:ribosomal protein S18 acetylase RimI-like enzyme